MHKLKHNLPDIVNNVVLIGPPIFFTLDFETTLTGFISVSTKATVCFSTILLIETSVSPDITASQVSNS